MLNRDNCQVSVSANLINIIRFAQGFRIEGAALSFAFKLDRHFKADLNECAVLSDSLERHGGAQSVTDRPSIGEVNETLGKLTEAALAKAKLLNDSNEGDEIFEYIKNAIDQMRTNEKELREFTAKAQKLFDLKQKLQDLEGIVREESLDGSSEDLVEGRNT